jgi:hypothetical protein
MLLEYRNVVTACKWVMTSVVNAALAVGPVHEHLAKRPAVGTSSASSISHAADSLIEVSSADRVTWAMGGPRDFERRVLDVFGVLGAHDGLDMMVIRQNESFVKEMTTHQLCWLLWRRFLYDRGCRSLKAQPCIWEF